MSLLALNIEAQSKAAQTDNKFLPVIASKRSNLVLHNPHYPLSLKLYPGCLYIAIENYFAEDLRSTNEVCHRPGLVLTGDREDPSRWQDVR
jgi:hypothetical protein